MISATCLEAEPWRTLIRKHGSAQKAGNKEAVIRGARGYGFVLFTDSFIIQLSNMYSRVCIVLRALSAMLFIIALNGHHILGCVCAVLIESETEL